MQALTQTHLEDKNIAAPGIHPPSRILLLDDNVQFCELIKEFIELKSSYQIVTVHNGVDGVRKIMAEDFDMIACDMMMPRLSGDMFYRAVQRVRPNLCERFVFITGNHTNPSVLDFINEANGLMLSKPFPMHDLLDLFGFVKLRSLIRSS